MAKAKTSAFFCQNCGYESSKWIVIIPACREWNTFVEELVDRKALSTSGKIKPATEAKPVPLSAIKTSDEERISTSMPGAGSCIGRGSCKRSSTVLGWSIRESVNQRFYYKSAGICPGRIFRYCMCPGKSSCMPLSQRSLVIIRCLLFVITRMTQEKI